MEGLSFRVFIGLMIILWHVDWVGGYHRDYLYDIVDDDKQRFHDAQAITIPPPSMEPEQFTLCLGNELSFSIPDLLACNASIFGGPNPGSGVCNVTFNIPRNETLNNRVYGVTELLRMHGFLFDRYGSVWWNLLRLFIMCSPIYYLSYLHKYTNHYDEDTTWNPRLYDGTNTKGYRAPAYLRAGHYLMDMNEPVERYVGLIQLSLIFRQEVEGKHDMKLAIKSLSIDSGFNPVPGVNFHIIANVPIPEIDEDELTEGQALKRRLKKQGLVSRKQFRFNIEQIHARRLVLVASKEYQRRKKERGHEPLFEHNLEAQESMDYALMCSREERIATQLRLEEERRERDRTIDYNWEKSNKNFRDHRRRMREHEEKIAAERRARVAMGLPAMRNEELDLLY